MSKDTKSLRKDMKQSYMDGLVLLDEAINVIASNEMDWLQKQTPSDIDKYFAELRIYLDNPNY